MVQSSWMDFIAFNCSQQQVHNFYSLQNQPMIRAGWKCVRFRSRKCDAFAGGIKKYILYKRKVKSMVLNCFPLLGRLQKHTHTLSWWSSHSSFKEHKLFLPIKIRCSVLFVCHHFLIHYSCALYDDCSAKNVLQKAIKTIVIKTIIRRKKTYISKSATFLHVRLRVRIESNNNKILAKHTQTIHTTTCWVVFRACNTRKSSAVGGA